LTTLLVVADITTGGGDYFGFLIVFAVISGLIGMAIGGSKGKAGAGFVLGLFLGFIGWIIAAVLQPTPEVVARRQAAVNASMARMSPPSPQPAPLAPPIELEPCPSCGRMVGRNDQFCQYCAVPLSRSCPWCAERIKASAVVCRFCGRDIKPVGASGPEPAT
jgi:hypothetical protein